MSPPLLHYGSSTALHTHFQQNTHTNYHKGCARMPNQQKFGSSISENAGHRKHQLKTDLIPHRALFATDLLLFLWWLFWTYGHFSWVIYDHFSQQVTSGALHFPRLLVDPKMSPPLLHSDSNTALKKHKQKPFSCVQKRAKSAQTLEGKRKESSESC